MKDCPCTYIPGGPIKGTEFWLNDLWKFESEDKNLLLDRQGHILILREDLCSSIWSHEISEDLLLKLLQRKFAYEPENIDKNEGEKNSEIKPRFL